MIKARYGVIVLSSLITMNLFAKIVEEPQTAESAMMALEKSECSSDIITAGVCQDIDTLYSIILSSTEDSRFIDANSILIPYKSMPCEMRLILSTRKTINSIAYSSILHETVKGDNAGLVAIIFQKASFIGSGFQQFAKELVNAVDANGKKPIDYTTDPQIIALLTFYMNLP